MSSYAQSIFIYATVTDIFLIIQVVWAVAQGS